MDPTAVTVSAITSAGIVLAAWLSRPTIGTHVAARRTRRDVAEVKAQFENNGGSSAKDQLDRIENGLTAVKTDLAHLRGRFDQHLTDPPKGDQP